MSKEPEKENPEEIQKLIKEISSLEDDLKEFRQGIRRIQFAPHEKQGQSEVVGPQHGELIAELEDIADKLENLPKKWENE